MARISEEEAPLVMDTPLGRLSADHRSNITEHLPALSDQLVLLVTDEELHDQARVNLESVSLASQQGRQEPDAKACVEKPRV